PYDLVPELGRPARRELDPLVHDRRKCRGTGRNFGHLADRLVQKLDRITGTDGSRFGKASEELTPHLGAFHEGLPFLVEELLRYEDQLVEYLGDERRVDVLPKLRVPDDVAWAVRQGLAGIDGFLHDHMRLEWSILGLAEQPDLELVGHPVELPFDVDFLDLHMTSLGLVERDVVQGQQISQIQGIVDDRRGQWSRIPQHMHRSRLQDVVPHQVNRHATGTEHRLVSATRASRIDNDRSILDYVRIRAPGRYDGDIPVERGGFEFSLAIPAHGLGWGRARIQLDLVMQDETLDQVRLQSLHAGIGLGRFVVGLPYVAGIASICPPLVTEPGVDRSQDDPVVKRRCVSRLLGRDPNSIARHVALERCRVL